jgi:hypothetical protein
MGPKAGESPLTGEDIRDAERGPYKVVTVASNWFQVRHPQEPRARSAVPDKTRAIQLAAKFNREVNPSNESDDASQ